MKPIFCRYFPLIAVLFLGSCAANKSSVNAFGGSWKQNDAVASGDKHVRSEAAGNISENSNYPEPNAEILPAENANTPAAFVQETECKNKPVLLQNSGNKSERVKQLAPLKLAGKLVKNAPEDAGSNQAIALILCALVGMFGIHRFYLGYNFIGVIQLLTLGGFGIWFFIDLVRIILGSLKPKHGEYTEKLSENSKKKEDKTPPTQTY